MTYRLTRLLGITLGGLATQLCGHGTAVSAEQIYPARPIRIIAPFAPGGGTDFMARVAALKMTEALGQQVIVDNRPGAGGLLGTELGIKAAADGYTFTLIGGSYGVSPSLYRLGFDPIHDITAVIQLSQGPYLVVVHPSLPVKTIREFIALAKSRPNSLNYASGGRGTHTHLSTELFADMAGIKLVHVPYKGTRPAGIDTIAGHIQVIFGSIAGTLSQMRSGRLRGIAVTSSKRVDAAPEIPTVEESGLKGYVVILWHGVIGPKGLPKPILDRVNSELNKILQTKDMQDKLAAEGVSPAGGTPEQFNGLIQKEISTWRQVVQKAGIKAE